MIFVTGPMYSGKKEYIRQFLHLTQEEFSEKAVWDVEQLATDCDNLEQLADHLATKEIIIATEVGGGVVPINPQQRRNREAAGRLACLLAQRAERVIRVCCGLPQILKG